MGQEKISHEDIQRRDSNRQDDGKWGAWASGESAAELLPPHVEPPSLDEIVAESKHMDADEIAEWTEQGHRFETGGASVRARQAPGEITFTTDHGDFMARPGGWVVMNADGDCITVDDESFREQYQFADHQGADPTTLTGTVSDGVEVPVERTYANDLLEIDLGQDAHPDEYDQRGQEIFDETGIDPDDPRFKAMDEAEGNSRDAHIRAVKQGRTRWLRRAQMLTALGTGNRLRIFQAWRDMRRDTRIRKNLMSEEQYWGSVAHDMQRQAEMVQTATLDKKGTAGAAAGDFIIDGGPGPQRQPDPEPTNHDHRALGHTAEMPEVAPEITTPKGPESPRMPSQPDTGDIATGQNHG